MLQFSFADASRYDSEVLSIATAISDMALSEDRICDFFHNTGKQLEKAYIIDYDLDRICVSLDPDAISETNADFIIRTWNLGIRTNPYSLLVDWTFHCMGDSSDSEGSCSQESCDGTARLLVFGKYGGLDDDVQDINQVARLKAAIHSGYGGLKDWESRLTHEKRIARWYAKWFQAICDHDEFSDIQEADDEMRVLTIVKKCYSEVLKDEMFETETILDCIKKYVTSRFQQEWSDETNRDAEGRDRFIRFLRAYPTAVLLWLIRENVLPDSYESLAGLNGSLRIFDDVTRIETNAYKDCIHLTEVYIPDSVTEIGEGAFSGCVNLKEIRLSANLTKVPARAFSRCKSLLKVFIPSNVTVIDDHAFSDCESITEIRIPGKLKRIGVGVFDGCLRIKTIILPPEIDAIPAFSFARCESLSHVFIPDSVTDIDDYAFSNCTKVKDIRFPDGLKKMGQWALKGCSGLKEIVLPSSLLEIGNGAFSGCSSVKDVQIPDGVKKIKTATFMDCASLRTIRIPNDLEEIGIDSFFGCAKLKEIHLPDSLRVLGRGAFEGALGLKKVSIPKGLDLSYTRIAKDVQVVER